MALLLPLVVISVVLVSDPESATVLAPDFLRCNPRATRLVDDILRLDKRELVPLLAPSTDGGDEALDVR